MKSCLVSALFAAAALLPSSSLVRVAAHAPTYARAAACIEGLSAPASVSQVVYFRAVEPGEVLGVRLSLRDDAGVWGELRGAGLKVSMGVSRRHQLARSGTRFFVGCLEEAEAAAVCAKAVEFPSASRVPLTIPDTGEVEPFTQTSYFSIAPATQGGVITATGANCTRDSQLTVLMLAGNAGVQGGSVVIGTSETFSLAELASFPVYLARNHGSWGNGNYVYHVLFGLAVVLALVGERAVGSPPAPPPPHLGEEGAEARERRGTGLLLTLASAAAYAVCVADLALQMAFASQQPAVRASTSAWGLFLGVVLLSANAAPMLLALEVHRVATEDEGGEGELGLVHAAFAALLLTVCGGSAFQLAGTPALQQLVAPLLVALLLTFVALWARSALSAHTATHGLLCACGVMLLFYVGSGYWIGPVLMAAGSAWALARALGASAM